MAVKAEGHGSGGTGGACGGPSTPVLVEVMPQSPSNDGNGIVIEDYLFKQGSRSSNYWHDRYFVLTVDGTLRYYNKKEDLKPKARLELNQQPDCEVSDIFVAKQKNQLLYCVKLTWTVTSDDDNESVYSLPTATLQNDETEHNEATAAATPHADENNDTASKAGKQRNIFRKLSMKRRASFSANSNNHVAGSTTNVYRDDGMRPSSSSSFALTNMPRTPLRSTISREKSAPHPSTPGQRSIDGESITVGSRMRPTMPPFPTAAAANESDEVPRIPAMVEVQEHETKAITTTNRDAETVTVRAGNSRMKLYDDNLDSERVYLRSQYLAEAKEKKRVAKRKVAEGAKYAVAAGAAVGVAFVTLGIGLVAGLVALSVGAAAGASSTATGAVFKKKRDGIIVIGTADYDRMRRWKACIDAFLASHMIQNSKWGQLFVGDGSNKRRVLIFPKPNEYSRNSGSSFAPDSPSPDASSSPRDTAGAMFSERTASAKWKPMEGGWISFLGTGPQGLRIFREEQPPARNRRFLRNLSIDDQPCPAMKSHLVLDATPLNAFLCLMSQGQLPQGSGRGTTPLTPNSGQRSSFRIIESIDDNTDVIHMVCNPLYLFPSWTSPRDFVLYRYWRLEEDGNFIVCFESVQHKDCPPYPGYCRGVMHQVITLSPNKKDRRRKVGTAPKDQSPECLMTAVVQVDPKGWVPIAPVNLFSNQGYGDAFAVAALMQLLDIRDAIDQDRFIPVSLDDGMPFSRRSMSSGSDSNLPGGDSAHLPHIDSMLSDGDFPEHLVNYDFTFSNRETVRYEDSPTGIATTPPALPVDKWAEPDPNSFRVRGRTYKEDRKKINAGASIGRLFAVDVIKVDKPIYSGVTVHPKERVQMALQREKLDKDGSDMPAFVFVVNIVLPGPPFYHGVFYYAIDDMSTIDGSDGSPSSLLCKMFFFGGSDSFRDKTFKMIPQVVEGNFIVRKAVGSTPAIMGKKLKQTYVQTERSFEVILDCGSSSVATGVIRLSLGYAKTLVVDMGYLLEGDDEVHLPERLLGCARVRQLDFGAKLRRVESVPSS